MQTLGLCLSVHLSALFLWRECIQRTLSLVPGSVFSQPRQMLLLLNAQQQVLETQPNLETRFLTTHVPVYQIT